MKFSLLQKAIINELKDNPVLLKKNGDSMPLLLKHMRVIFLKHFRDRSILEISEETKYSLAQVKRILRNYHVLDEEVYNYSLQISIQEDQKEFTRFINSVLDIGA